MALITIKELRIGYRGPLLLDDVSCQIDAGQRIGLLGRNGAGKTTFLRILSGQVEPDGGEVAFAPGTKVALLQQEVPLEMEGSVAEVAAAGLGECTDVETAWKGEQQVKRITPHLESIILKAPTLHRQTNRAVARWECWTEQE